MLCEDIIIKTPWWKRCWPFKVYFEWRFCHRGLKAFDNLPFVENNTIPMFDLTSVQPISEPVSRIWFLSYEYEENEKIGQEVTT